MIGKRSICEFFWLTIICTAVFFVNVEVQAQEKVTLKFLNLQEEPHIIPLIQAFEVAYPNIKIEIQTMPWRDYFMAMEAAVVSSSDTPDVMEIDVPLNVSYAVRGFTLPLDEYLDEEDLNDFVDVSIDAATWKNTIYSLPRQTSGQLLYFNVDLFNEFGIETPPREVEKRWTWERVVEAAKKLTVDRDGDGTTDIWGFAFDQVDRPYQILPLPQSLGESMLSPDGLTASGYVDSEKSIQAAKFYYDLYNTWKIAPQGILADETTEWFGAGKIALFVGGEWNRYTYDRNYPELNWDASAHPYFEGGKIATPTGSWHLAVNRNSKNIKEGVEFIKYMTNKPMSVLWYETHGQMPVRKSVYEFYKDHFSKHPNNILYYDFLNTAVPRPITPGYHEWELAVEQAYADIRSGVEPEVALKEAAAKIDRMLEKYKQLVEE
ncbi:MAG: extracellular solute-binding protein [Thermoanaerobacteraceae bacterium]|nr:extracellular solute-binding protein [Thermoanaerobacteraceae bacterium]